MDLQKCSVAFMDAKNGFLTKFHIEIVIKKKITTFFCRKKIFFENENFDFEKYFCSFSKNIFFFDEKKSWEKNWITISMWNFVRNPFLASINATEQYWRPQSPLKQIQIFVCFFGTLNFTGSIRYFIGSVQQKQFCLKGSPRLTLF